MSLFGDQIGSVGSLVGAAMETAGHYMQSVFLDVLINEYFAQHLGALLFAMSIAIAIFIISIGGQYKFGLWFLVGPPLFFYMINVRTGSWGADWQFGAYHYSHEEVKRASRDAIPLKARGGLKNEAQVSTFFAMYDELTSGVVQSFIRVLNLEDTYSNINFINKMQRYFGFKTPPMPSSSMLGYFSTVFVNNCSPYLNAAYHIANAGTNLPDSEETTDALEELQESGSLPVVKINENLTEFVTSTNAILKKVDPNIPRLPDPERADSYTCQQLWKQMTTVIRHTETDSVVDMLINIYLAEDQLPEELKDPIRKATYKEDLKKQIEAKFTYEVSKDGVVLRTAEISDDEKLMYLINEVTARMMFRYISTVMPQFLAHEQGSGPDDLPVKGHYQILDPNRALRVMQATDKYLGIGKYLSGMLSLPYVQGLGLYFLSLAFPFFAFALLIPGRHHAFLLWMGLWFWLKSWDIGFAIVMLIDNMLFALMPQGRPITNGELDESPVALFKTVLNQADPIYSQYTYYNLIATCMAAVPIVSAAMVKRGGKEVAHALNQGFSHFCGKVGESMMSYSRALRVQSSAMKAQVNIYDAGRRAMWESFRYDPIQTAAALKAVGMNLGQQEVQQIMKRTPKGLQLLAKAGEKLMNATEDQQKNIAVAHWKYNFQRAIYNESASDLNLSLAAEACMHRYNSHDFRSSFKSVMDSRLSMWTMENEYFNDQGFYDALYNIPQNFLWGSNRQSKY